ncbi:pyruvate dehydrogenase (acetyl-transferring) E1 component subunit alpha [bacterium]|nr:pyruvate dehydrogenase (acetyl-transferring) E1 component subunit alpha [bacterium]
MKESKEELSGYLRRMMDIRLFEEKVMELLAKNIIKGASHLYAGEEAVAVGACSAIEEDDYITSTHRGHGHCLAKGGKLPEMMAELCGKATGYCKGRGGSMHIADVTKGNLGATGIVASNLPVAVGAALSAKMRKTNQVVLCFFGDGASNNGIFHESLNMAAVWRLPVVFVCENNLYGMSVAAKRCSAVQDMADKAKGYDIPSMICDGMDILDVKETIKKAVERAREGDGPTLVECKTYRYFGHSRSDPRAYRTKEEEKEWRNKCPIKQFSKKLIDNKILTEEEIAQIEKQSEEAVESAEKFAIESPYPDVKELMDDIYAPSPADLLNGGAIR